MVCKLQLVVSWRENICVMCILFFHVGAACPLVLISREEEFSSRLSNKANFHDCTPLHYAVLADDLESVRILLEYGMYYHKLCTKLTPLLTFSAYGVCLQDWLPCPDIALVAGSYQLPLPPPPRHTFF